MDTGISRKWMDLRDNQRLPIETAVGVAVASGLRRFFVNKPQFRGDMRNASQGGLLLRVDRVVPPGAVLKVWVQVEYKGEWQTLELPGDVIWSRPDNSTGSFLMGVCLRSRPGRSMHVWRKTMQEELRDFAGSRKCR